MQSQRDTTKEDCRQWNTFLQCYMDWSYIMADSIIANALKNGIDSPKYEGFDAVHI